MKATFILAWLGSILLSFALTFAVWYAIIHFVRKFW